MDVLIALLNALGKNDPQWQSYLKRHDQKIIGFHKLRLVIASGSLHALPNDVKPHAHLHDSISKIHQCWLDETPEALHITQDRACIEEGFWALKRLDLNPLPWTLSLLGAVPGLCVHEALCLLGDGMHNLIKILQHALALKLHGLFMHQQDLEILTKELSDLLIRIQHLEDSA